jgi:hypothetical protein
MNPSRMGTEVKELKLELSDGSELIWSYTSGFFHRWQKEKAELLDEWDEESHGYETHIEMFLAGAGSIVQKRTEAKTKYSPALVSYWVHSLDSKVGPHDAIQGLLRRKKAGTLSARGLQLLDEIALNLELA